MNNVSSKLAEEILTTCKEFQPTKTTKAEIRRFRKLLASLIREKYPKKSKAGV